MKTNVILFAATLLALPTRTPASEGLEAKVHAADIEQFHTLINDAYGHPYAPVYRRELIDHALTSRRLDLIADVFSNPNLTIYFRKKAGELENSDYTDKIAIVMLRSPMATFWPYEGLPINSNGIIEYAGPEPLLIKPLTTGFERLIPSVSRETLKTMIWTKAGRTQLADQLYAAMQAKGVTFTDTERAILQGGSGTAAPTPSSTPAPRTTTPLVKPVPAVVPKETAPQANTAPTDLDHNPADKRSAAFWVPLVGLAVTAALWLAGRKKT
jgi:hypothetical protein